MQTIQAIAQSLGLSVRAVRLRVDALGDLVSPYLDRGPRNEVLFDGSALSILRRVEDLRQGEALSVRQAVERVRSEVGGNRVEGLRQGASSVASTSSEVVVRVLERQIEDLRQERDHWRELAFSLRDQLALPNPRRRWWRRVLGVASGSA